ncbi:hypothetical protein QQS21_004582 [Conoideocrella luteorostrata]|uniref:Polyketide synthase n=1 Tax=Conoideocrella luteorostrata TaxID=1105319 RepID=A0AAJ0CTL3_9HYPO|nr:hypothetical protein QQS21_004582 [Conoideocrella luteorostrata]
MVDRLARARQANSVLIYGSQALCPADNVLESIRCSVLSSDEYLWILQTLAGLPDWITKLKHVSNAFHETAEKLLVDLNVWFKTGSGPRASFKSSNIILTPLTVINQLMQYVAYLKIAYPTLDLNQALALPRYSTQTAGFCTGLLSASAVSCSRDEESFAKYGATSIRIAMLCGLIVDAQNFSEQEDRAISLATAWHSHEAQEQMCEMLKSFPETYISVFYDETRATLTLPTKYAAALRQQLKTIGVTATEVGLHGRFHWPGHEENAERAVVFADAHAEFQFLDSDHLILPTHSNSGKDFNGPLHREIIQSILLEPPLWFQTMSRIQEKTLQDSKSLLISFGLDRYVPPSLSRTLTPQLVNMAELERQTGGVDAAMSSRLYTDTDIAIVGMSCKVAGADDLEEFWQILCEGNSKHREVPADRFTFKSAYREADGQRKWFGNFINHHDAFDHKFFKKTPRKVASMDPQQRQVLQLAYQAVEQSGYFRRSRPDKNVGCYIGVCAVDYENNVACHPSNAFSATGTLRGFIAGKISHFFGWTGPGLTIDSACSSSVVSVHLACRAILNGECNAAIAGGTHVMTSPLCYQNLAGASFLSKTGQCKPFDALADGYCRGEGCATVFLKKLSSAIADGDQVLGVIASTAVQQNENCTPIIVPNAPSLTDLFRTVIRKAHLRPEQIGVVEAHGTGTAVGDPAEYDSIRRILGGDATKRTSQLMLSSVKGLIGHLECTSGIISLVKTVLMIKNGAIPPQASFKTLNPAIKAEPSDRITIPASVTSWNNGFRAALINNYGASGSNASMIVVEAPPSCHDLQQQAASGDGIVKRPFWICGLDDESLGAYAGALLRFVRKHKSNSIADLSFNLARQSNRTLPRRVVFTAHSLSELEEKLETAAKKGSPLQLADKNTDCSQSVILCFGGQISKFVGLHRQLYESVRILRKYLDECNNVCRSLGITSIFPHIFQREPINDAVRLQVALFALQYSCAKCWIDSGVQPVAVLGHSFGELTALCIAGVLSLPQALTMIAARGRIIRDQWGADKGAMMAVEANLKDVERLIELSNATLDKDRDPAVIACFNGPHSFTLAGSSVAIEAVANILSSDTSFPVKSKKLAVTNAFHSTLVEPLLVPLKESALDLTFERPIMEWARCTETESEPEISAEFFGEHMRQPVYFQHCVQRLAKRYPECVWLEAGSNSTVTAMVSRALGAPQRNSFVPVNITSDSACDNLADATVNLWKAGIDVTYWEHSSLQTSQYSVQLLPPYQFAKSKHWIELKEGPPLEAVEKPSVTSEPEKIPASLLTFVGYQDGTIKRHTRFRVNTMIPKFENLMIGHKIAHTAPICPATVQIDLAIDALSQLVSLGADFNPEIYGLENLAPICVDSSLSLSLDLVASEARVGEWLFKLISTSGPASRRSTATHTTGRIIPSTKDLSTELDLSRYQRIISHDHCLELLNSLDPDDAIQGRNIYKTFAEVVDYGDQYRGLVKLVGKGNISAGHVVKSYNNETWFDAHLSDTFCQVGGIFVNCMTDRPSVDIYISRGLERWMRSKKILHDRPQRYDILAYHNGSTASGGFLSDIFVFNPDTGALVEAILGINYVQVHKESIKKLLNRLTNSSTIQPVPPKEAVSERAIFVNDPQTTVPVIQATSNSPTKKSKLQEMKCSRPPRTIQNDILPKLTAIISELSGIDEDHITLESNLADLGIDSLMGMELVTELENKFNCKFSLDEAAEVIDVKSLVECTRKTIEAGEIRAIDGEDEIGEESDFDSTLDSGSVSPKTPIKSTTSIEDPAIVSAAISSKVDIVGVLAELIGIKRHELICHRKHSTTMHSISPKTHNATRII